MPTYSYECKKCGDVTDVFHSMSANPRVKCGVCGGATRRLLGTGAGLIFKGSGFYETDYKTKTGTKDAPEPSTPKTESVSESKSESKAAPVSESKTEPTSASKSASKSKSKGGVSTGSKKSK